MSKHTFDIFNGSATASLATVTFYDMTRRTASFEARAIAKRLSPQDWTISYLEPEETRTPAEKFIDEFVEVRS
jgi:hypothetical protein